MDEVNRTINILANWLDWQASEPFKCMCLGLDIFVRMLFSFLAYTQINVSFSFMFLLNHDGDKGLTYVLILLSLMNQSFEPMFWRVMLNHDKNFLRVMFNTIIENS